MRVLIVEDDGELAASLASVLEEAGMVVEIAADGNDASFLGCTEKYDAAVLDLGLPGLDGVSVLKQWREQGITFPVLVLTGRRVLPLTSSTAPAMASSVKGTPAVRRACMWWTMLLSFTMFSSSHG